MLGAADGSVQLKAGEEGSVQEAEPRPIQRIRQDQSCFLMGHLVCEATFFWISFGDIGVKKRQRQGPNKSPVWFQSSDSRVWL